MQRFAEIGFDRQYDECGIQQHTVLPHERSRCRDFTGRSVVPQQLENRGSGEAAEPEPKPESAFGMNGAGKDDDSGYQRQHLVYNQKGVDVQILKR